MHQGYALFTPAMMDSKQASERASERVCLYVFVFFPLGHLYSNTKKTVGILDLGGGSTQITFLPKSKVRQASHLMRKSASGDKR